MSEKTYLKILQWGIYLALFTPLIIFTSLLFPFITGKTFYFRVIVEILLAVFILFIWQYRQYVPKKKILTLALLVFSGIMIITSFTGLDFNLSFWSDVERMEGVFGFLHLVVFFIIIVSVFRTKKDWKKLLYAFAGSSLGLCLYALGQKTGSDLFLLSSDSRVSSTLGNSAYLGAFALFGIAVFLLLLIKEKGIYKKIMYASGAFLNALILIFTGTRGAYLGLMFAVFIAFILYIALVKNKKIKIILSSIFIGVIFIGGLVFWDMNSAKPHLKGNFYLYRLTHFSLNDATWNTRLISWKSGIEALKERPFFGVGSGNYAYYFDKHFPPIFYSYTAQQTFFDHAHNNIVDIAVTTGLFGLAAYLAICGIILYYLIYSYRTKKIGLNEFIILFCLMAAYFAQNIFVFDCLVTYIAFFVITGYIAFPHYNSEDVAVEDNYENKGKKINPILAFGASAFSLYLIINFNVIPAIAMKKTVDVQYKIYKENDFIAGYEKMKEALAYGTVFDRDMRASFSNIIISNGSQLAKKVGNDKLLEIVEYSIAESEKNLKLNPLDTIFNLNLGQLYNIKAIITKDTEILAQAEYYIRKSLEASPGRLQLHFTLAENKLISGQYEEAVKILENAKDLNPNYSEVYANLARAYSYSKKEVDSMEAMAKAILLGYKNVSEHQLDLLINYFVGKNDYNILIILYNRKVSLQSEDAKLRAQLAAVYAKLGQNDKAYDSVMKAVELDSNLKETADKFLEMLGNGELLEKKY